MNAGYPIKKSIFINGENQLELKTYSLPESLNFNEDCALITMKGITGEPIFISKEEEVATFEVRATITPKGDFLVMFPQGKHYGWGNRQKVNRMMALRSADGCKTWSEPKEAFDIDYNQHGFVPLIPEGSSRIYSFGTQPVWDRYDPTAGKNENSAIGYLYSDDDGKTWQGPVLIEPVEDPDFAGMSVTRMCETGRGTWLIGAHNGYRWEAAGRTDKKFSLSTWQYLLRSEDQGKTWHILPGKRDGGWQYVPYERMDEGRPICLGGEEVLMLARTPEGHIWRLFSEDDGKTWTKPEPTTLIHPDAPPMVFMLSDHKTLVCFHHNRFHDINYGGLSSDKDEIMADRSEIWASFSADKGVTWSEPRFIFASVADPGYSQPFYNYQCSYIDMVEDGTTIHLLVPHLWHEILHLELDEKDLFSAPTKKELFPDAKEDGQTAAAKEETAAKKAAHSDLFA